MPKYLELDQIDVDGALRETAGEAVAVLEEAGDTRAAFLKKAGLAGGAVAGGGLLLGSLIPDAARAAGRPPRTFGKGDVGILNFALTLEYLEADFYNETTRNNNRKTFITDKQIGQLLKRVTTDENVHVKLLSGALGSAAVKRPKFDFRGTTRGQDIFIKTSYELENTGVHAYLGQAVNLRSKFFLMAATTIATVEGRHASVAGMLFQKTSGSISPDGPFDVPFSGPKVIKNVRRTGFPTTRFGG